MSFDPKRAINGKWGELWIDNEKYNNVSECQGKVKADKVDVPMCGRPGKAKKNSGWEGTGTVKFTKIDSKLAKKVATAIKKCTALNSTIISKLTDPDAYGYESIVYYGVEFDESTLSDWATEKIVEESYPFTFTDFDFVNEITVPDSELTP